MHRTGKSSVSVRYRDGHEIQGSKRSDSDLVALPVSELTTHGEFGPVLLMVLGDAGKGKLFWSHWEQGGIGMSAVFRFTVPEDQSNYMVDVPQGLVREKTFPAYHGELAIDPSSGAILRISVIADPAPPDEMVRSSIMVEYGPVQIGEKPYICPVRSVAFARIAVGETQDKTTPMKNELNDVAFTDYHLFRSESRIVPVTGNMDEQAAPAK
jgi:hypothetical protein